MAHAPRFRSGGARSTPPLLPRALRPSPRRGDTLASAIAARAGAWAVLAAAGCAALSCSADDTGSAGTSGRDGSEVREPAADLTAEPGLSDEAATDSQTPTEPPTDDGQRPVSAEEGATPSEVALDTPAGDNNGEAANGEDPTMETSDADATAEQEPEETPTVDAPLPPVTVYVAGDSIVSNYADTPSPSDQAGWGQMLRELFGDGVTVVNRARGGRTALWLSMEGEVAAMLATAQPGDALLVEFGTNDSHPTATFEVDGQTLPRFADPDTDFKRHLSELYIAPARARGVEVVLVTPPPRNSAYCTGGNSLGRWARAMRELGAAEEVPVVTLNQQMVAHLQAICPAPSPEDVFFLRADGSVDGTHFQENGARLMTRFITESLRELNSPLSRYLRPAGAQ